MASETGRLKGERRLLWSGQLGVGSGTSLEPKDNPGSGQVALDLPGPAVCQVSWHLRVISR